MLDMAPHHSMPIPPQTPLTEAELCAWLGTAAPGDAITYFRGALARELCPQLGLLEAADRITLAKLARRAWKLADDGLAHLVQRRRGFEDYEYILVARRRARRNAPSITHLLLHRAPSAPARWETRGCRLTASPPACWPPASSTP
jgi:hypothetical protein